MDARLRQRSSPIVLDYAISQTAPGLQHGGATASHPFSTSAGPPSDAAGLSTSLALQSGLWSAGWGGYASYSAESTHTAVFRAPSVPPAAATAAAATAAAAQADGLTLQEFGPDDIMQLADYLGDDSAEASEQRIPSASNSATCTADIAAHPSTYGLQDAVAQDLFRNSHSIHSTLGRAAAAAAALKPAGVASIPGDQLLMYPMQQQQQQSLDRSFSINSWEAATSVDPSAVYNIASGPYGVTGLEYGLQGYPPLNSGTNDHKGYKHLSPPPAARAFQADGRYSAAAAAVAAAVVSAGSAGESSTQVPSPSAPTKPATAAVAVAEGRGRGAAAPASRHRGRTAAAAAVDQRREVNRLTQQRIRRERQAEHQKLREQLAIMNEQVSRLQASFRSQQASQAQLLSRLGEVTGKWRDSVAENARLSADNVAMRAQVADLQMQLMAYHAQRR